LLADDRAKVFEFDRGNTLVVVNIDHRADADIDLIDGQ
jgi:hypothetical protein